MGELLKFSSAAEEAKYFKNLAKDLQERLRDTQQELEEFQMHSKDLESELETQLEQEEKNSRELRSMNTRLARDCEILKDKLEKVQHDSNKQIRDLQDELCTEKVQREDLQKYVRELEQVNDDLERAKRATLCSVEDFEGRLNQAYERNAFLENELDDKESLTFMVQRFKDEARDLKQELLIQQSLNKGGPMPNNDKAAEKILEMSPPEKLSPGNEPTTPNRNHYTHNTPLTPSARISALNIVGDLLRRVGALETKLASCRNYVKESPQKSEEPTSPVKTPAESRHLKRSSLSLSKDGISLTA